MTRYLSLAEYFWLAEQVTGTAADVLVKVSRVDLADSALHAPGAGFGERTSIPTSSTRPRSSCAGSRGIIRSPMATRVRHGRRSSCSSSRNGGRWEPDPPNVDEAEEAMLAVAAHEVDESWLSDRLRERIGFEETE